MYDLGFVRVRCRFVVGSEGDEFSCTTASRRDYGCGAGSMPFWIYRGYGHFLFEGTWTDISCFFTEANGLAFPFVVAPALGQLTLIHGIFWLRISKGPSIAVALTV